jgi:hypothetical protein
MDSALDARHHASHDVLAGLEDQTMTSPAPANTMRFAYKPRAGRMILAGVFFAACAVDLGHAAMTNDRGVIIEDAIRLGPEGATILYWVLSATSAAFVALSVASSLALWGRPPSCLVLDDEAVALPGRWNRGTRRVPYATIERVELSVVYRQHLLVLVTRSGKFAIAGMMLQSNDELKQVASEIERRRGIAARQS